MLSLSSSNRNALVMSQSEYLTQKSCFTLISCVKNKVKFKTSFRISFLWQELTTKNKQKFKTCCQSLKLVRNYTKQKHTQKSNRIIKKECKNNQPTEEWINSAANTQNKYKTVGNKQIGVMWWWRWWRETKENRKKRGRCMEKVVHTI